MAILTMDWKRVVAANVRRLRIARGLSQEELAARAGVSARYLGSIERGEYAVTVVVLGQLARALRTTPAELMRRPGQ